MVGILASTVQNDLKIHYDVFLTIMEASPHGQNRQSQQGRHHYQKQQREIYVYMLIDMAVPSDRNTSVRVAEKLSQYKDLEIETAIMWGMKTQIVPVVIGTLRVIKKGIDKQISKIPGNINVTELRKIALLGSTHILRKVLSIKYTMTVH